MSRPSTKHLHLLPILSFLPLIAALLAITVYSVRLDQFAVAMVAIGYVAINIIYRALHGTLQVGYIVEYSLSALLVYFVLTEYV
jgi:hypothetical protein